MSLIRHARSKGPYLAVLAVLVLAALKRIEDFDIWFDLVIGRKIFESLAIPQAEFYVYTLLGEPTVFPEWGFGLLFYLTYRWFDYAGMGVAHALIGGGALYAFYRAAETERKYNPMALALLCALFMAVYHRMVYRPEIVLYLCLGCEVYVLEHYLADRRWQRLVSLPFLALLLSWFHPSAGRLDRLPRRLDGVGADSKCGSLLARRVSCLASEPLRVAADHDALRLRAE
jgi:hypothetical protein